MSIADDSSDDGDHLMIPNDADFEQQQYLNFYFYWKNDD